MKNEQLVTILDSIRFDLTEVQRCTQEEFTRNTLERVIEVFNLIKEDINSKNAQNSLKRILYNKMTSLKYTEPEKSLKLYKAYQLFKNGNITNEEVLNLLLEVAV